MKETTSSQFKPMKKKLESELISIAHRILKLTGREDLEKMLQEVTLLYQKITILKFLESNNNAQSAEQEEEVMELIDSLDESLDKSLNKISTSESSAFSEDESDVPSEEEAFLENNSEEEIVELATETIKDIVAQMPQETTAVDDLVDEINNNTPDQDPLLDFDSSFGQLPIFDPVEAPSPTDTSIENTSNIETVSLNDAIKTAGFQIGLNDRLAFVNHLFENNNDDYDRVISQINSMDSFEEITDFLENIIKPDYNNWEGKAEYETRFIEIIEKKFS